MADQGQQITNTIIEILEAEPEKRFQIQEMTSMMEVKLGFKHPTRMKLLINSLITSGRIAGRNNAWAQHKVMVVPTGETDPSVERAKQAVAEMNKKVIEAQAAQAAAEKRANETQAQSRIVEVIIKNDKGKGIKKIEGIFHERFERMLRLAEARMNIFIYGPTGCGKTHICEQVASSLNLPFYFVNCTSGMAEGVLGGRLLPIGAGGSFEYVTSEFIKAFEEGGLFLLDEMDAADPNVLLMINTALANGKIVVSNRNDKPYAVRHKDFICVGAANTLGTGADRLYAGRNKLDLATLDRFNIGKILMDYDPQVEAILCPDDILRNKLLKYRRGIKDHRLERAMSTRFLRDAYKMVSEFGWTLEDVDQAYFQGWRDDEANRVKNN